MNCITIQHCIVRQWAGEKAVSRYNYCIVIEAKRGRWARHWRAAGEARAERYDTAGGPGQDTARPPTTRPRARGLGAQAGPVLVLVHLAWFSTWFFDLVFFLSH